jgi:hypothetical protein
MADKQLISADSHFVEPPKMWAERLDARFRDRAPHVVNSKASQASIWSARILRPRPWPLFSVLELPR